VDVFAVASGPGAFTGLRIGIACIQGLAFAHGRPAVGLSALDALAQAAWSTGTLTPGDRVAVWMDAARHEVFAALYEICDDVLSAGLAPLRAIHPPSVGSADACLDHWRALLGQSDPIFVGDGALRYRAAIGQRLESPRIITEPPPLAAAMVPLALDASRRGLAGAPHAIRPLYVRRPDAEIARDVRAAGDERHG
jgi:tRNA threonylcarbamoyladenosine biosynthesis protein TsaB